MTFPQTTTVLLWLLFSKLEPIVAEAGAGQLCEVEPVEPTTPTLNTLTFTIIATVEPSIKRWDQMLDHICLTPWENESDHGMPTAFPPGQTAAPGTESGGKSGAYAPDSWCEIIYYDPFPDPNAHESRKPPSWVILTTVIPAEEDPSLPGDPELAGSRSFVVDPGASVLDISATDAPVPFPNESRASGTDLLTTTESIPGGASGLSVSESTAPGSTTFDPTPLDPTAPGSTTPSAPLTTMATSTSSGVESSSSSFNDISESTDGGGSVFTVSTPSVTPTGSEFSISTSTSTSSAVPTQTCSDLPNPDFGDGTLPPWYLSDQMTADSSVVSHDANGLEFAFALIPSQISFAQVYLNNLLPSCGDPPPLVTVTVRFQYQFTGTSTGCTLGVAINQGSPNIVDIADDGNSPGVWQSYEGTPIQVQLTYSPLFTLKMACQENVANEQAILVTDISVY